MGNIPFHFYGSIEVNSKEYNLLILLGKLVFSFHVHGNITVVNHPKVRPDVYTSIS